MIVGNVRMSERVKRLRKANRSVKALRSIVGGWKTLSGEPLIVMGHVSNQMLKTATAKLFKILELKLPDILENTEPSNKLAGYLGQMVFHEWFNRDWKAAVSYIDIEIEYWQKYHNVPALERPKERLSDAKIDGASVDIKTASPEYLKPEPENFGLIVPEAQFKHEWKRHDIYVWVLLLPSETVKKYQCSAWIYGYALKREIEAIKPEGGSRTVVWKDLHPMFLLRDWKTETAFIKDFRSLKVETKMAEALESLAGTTQVERTLEAFMEAT